jgi:thiamine transport system substrate-binding protein
VPASFSPTTVTLLTHDSFAVTKTLLTDFTARTGITIKVVSAGDAGEVVNKAALTAGNPEGDVLFGVDNTLISRALAAGVFDPYVSPAAGTEPAALTLATSDAVTPVDYGDVCVNLDDTWFAAHKVTPPTTLADLAKPEYKDLLVVENAATSSPGLAFLLATIARYGEDGYQGYWQSLRANGVKVVNGWTEAYEDTFSGGGAKGTRPIVVSYASSPPAEIVYASDPKPTKPSTSVMTDGCFRQVEYAGVLRGTTNPLAARAVVDWLLSPAVQADVPLSMFVDPAVPGTPLPKVFTDFAAVPAAPLTLDPALIDAKRSAWLEAWDQVTLR